MTHVLSVDADPTCPEGPLLASAVARPGSDRKRLWILTALCIAPWLLSAQTPSPAERASIRGREVIEAAARAMGSAGIADTLRILEGFRVEIGQTRRPGIAYTTPPYKLTNALDFQNGRYVEEVWTSVIGGYRVHFRQSARDGDAASAAYWSGRASPYRYPEAVLRSAANRVQWLRSIGAVRWNGAVYDTVALSDPYGNQLLLYFAQDTHLPAMTEILKDEPVFSLAGAMSYRWEYLDYRQVEQVRLPWRYITRYGGEVLEDLHVSEIRVNTHPPADMFPAAPAASASAPSIAPPPANPATIADNTYFFGGAINSLAVVMKDFILLVEGGWTDALAQRNLEMVRRLAPEKPLRYVVATHYHHDHIRGLRNYVAAGATVVAGPITRSEITRLTSQAPLLAPDVLARHPVPLRFETVTTHRTITDGVHSVELYDIGPTPHVDEMLIAYLPKERVLYEADALDINGSEVPQVNADTLDLVDKIRTLGLDPQVIVPAHGRLGAIDDLRRALEHRETGIDRQR